MYCHILYKGVAYEKKAVQGGYQAAFAFAGDGAHRTAGAGENSRRLGEHPCKAAFQISMADNSSVIKTTINIPYSYYSSGHVDRDIDVIDNYDPETDIVITAKIDFWWKICYNKSV